MCILPIRSTTSVFSFPSLFSSFLQKKRKKKIDIYSLVLLEMSRMYHNIYHSCEHGTPSDVCVFVTLAESLVHFCTISSQAESRLFTYSHKYLILGTPCRTENRNAHGCSGWKRQMGPEMHHLPFDISRNRFSVGK